MKNAAAALLLAAALSGCCSWGATSDAVSIPDVTFAPASLTAEIDTDAWHFVVCPRQTETRHLEIAVGRSETDFQTVTWSEGDDPAIPVPAAYASEPRLWVRLRVFDRKTADVCVRSDDTSRKELVTDREIETTVARTDTAGCACD